MRDVNIKITVDESNRDIIYLEYGSIMEIQRMRSLSPVIKVIMETLIDENSNLIVETESDNVIEGE